MPNITQTCRISGQQFIITEEDQKFYEKMGVPLPTLCPEERLRRRLAWRNECYLYNRKCSATGQPIISLHHEEKSFPVYDNRYWWSDKWDALDYGREFDFNKTFFEQFKELMDVVPQIAIMNDNGVNSENSEYCHDFSYGKDCYYITESWHIRDSLYSHHCDHVVEVVDCAGIFENSELLYECIACQSLYNCIFLQNSSSCSDCIFGIHLTGCKNCFGCVGLQYQEYCIWNTQYTKEEYESFIKTINLDSYKSLKHIQHQFETFKNSLPIPSSYIKNCENCEGHELFNCKNVLGFGAFNGENSKYIINSDSPKNSYDSQGGNYQWNLECQTCDNSYHAIASLWCWKSNTVLYSDNCHSCHDIFGCISLKHKKYCILNKQYSQQEYENLLPKIIHHIKETGEYGEFFPIQYSPYSYNETVAQEQFLISETAANAFGYTWRERPLTIHQKKFNIPDSIHNVSDDILTETLHCEITQRPFKIQPQELIFYRKMNIPLPRKHPDQRHLERVQKRNPRILFHRNCMLCNTLISTTYPPKHNGIIYCEACYKKHTNKGE